MKRKLFLFLTACTLFLIMFMPNSKAEAASKTITLDRSNAYESGRIWVYPGQKVKLEVINYGNDIVQARAWQSVRGKNIYYYNYWIKYGGSRFCIIPVSGTYFYFDLWSVFSGPGVGASMTVTTYY
ncbi:hypothetical protein ACM6Q7_28165 [Peribacillus butanolivorans]|uniref:hypothetical protein n=1 Tax=Peribacillus butanolivorans TaxID=421767 RepID=UPI0039FCF2FC